MRIISGQLKGKRLKTPKDSKTIRPALSQVREAIFSSLGDIEGKVFLDIFAGTGSLGFEALSRGADFIYFVDSGAEAINLIIENLNDLQLSEKAHIFKRKMPFGLEKIKLEKKPDVIFCDPPYDKNLINRTLSTLVKQNYVDPNSLIIVEHTKREVPNIKELELVKEKRFGQTFISYFKPVAT